SRQASLSQAALMLGDLDKECVAMKHIVTSATIAAFLVLPSIGTVFAAGQPVFTCGTAPALNIPGNSGSNTGSPFADGGQAGTVYAGERTLNGNSGNPASGNSGNQASIYDVACARNNSPPS